jgi:hypothetical protein
MDGDLGRRLLHPADDVQGPQQDARFPGRDLRAGARRDHLQGRSRSPGHRQRHPYGLGAGVWSRNGNVAYRMGRAIKAGRVWTNCYHAYPAHATFGGYKESGIGRETHKMMLDHYQQTKNLLVSYREQARLLLILHQQVAVRILEAHPAHHRRHRRHRRHLLPRRPRRQGLPYPLAPVHRRGVGRAAGGRARLTGSPQQDMP